MKPTKNHFLLTALLKNHSTLDKFLVKSYRIDINYCISIVKMFE